MSHSPSRSRSHSSHGSHDSHHSHGSHHSHSSHSSHSSHHASSDSMELPPPQPNTEVPAGGVAPPAAGALEPQSMSTELREVPHEEPGMTTLFIGMGPATRGVKADELTQYLGRFASSPEKILSVRMRGRCAFADIDTLEEAQKLIAALDGHMYEDKARMTVQISRNKKGEKAEKAEKAEKRTRGEERRVAPGGKATAQSIFVGLGPAGASISDGEITRKLEQVCPLTAFRRRGQCVFVEVGSLADANRLIAAMNNDYIGDARLSVQFSRENRKRERRVESRRDRSRGRGHRERRHSRRRHVSRDRRRRRSRSYSSTSSDSSYSTRSRSRSRGRRSYSTSTRSSSVSVDPRDRRSRRRGGRKY